MTKSEGELCREALYAIQKDAAELRGRVLTGLGMLKSRNAPYGLKNAASELFNDLVSWADTFGTNATTALKYLDTHTQHVSGEALAKTEPDNQPAVSINSCMNSMRATPPGSDYRTLAKAVLDAAGVKYED